MRRRLPHIDAAGHIQHVVFCTRDAFTGLPVTSEDWSAADHALDASKNGRVLIDEVADVVLNVITSGEPRHYRLLAWCVMPNHVHVLVRANADASLRVIVQRWKSISARSINRLFGREGSLWQANYFDRFMRDEAQLAATVDYIEMNPVVAGLALHPWLWRWSSAFRE